MAVVELAMIVVACGAMAVVFGRQERAEWRRIVARADGVLACERSSAMVTFGQPVRPDLRDAA
ncbi:MAG TPA: hypothetical protein VGJ70_19595 [Solirubrobacteraceae bacterium]